MKHDCMCSNRKWLPTNKEVLDLYKSYDDSLDQGSRMQVKGVISCKNPSLGSQGLGTEAIKTP